MHSHKFLFDKGKPAKKAAKAKLETWVPLEEPQLTDVEKESVLYGDATESIFIVRPAFLLHDGKEMGYVKGDHYNSYSIGAKLKRSPYMVLLGEEIASPSMQKFLKEKHTLLEPEMYYLDCFFSPGYGALKPQYILLEKVALSNIPTTSVLFKDISKKR